MFHPERHWRQLLCSGPSGCFVGALGAGNPQCFNGLVDYFELWLLKKCPFWDFPGGPGVRLSAFTAEGPVQVPGWGTKILQASRQA